MYVKGVMVPGIHSDFGGKLGMSILLQLCSHVLAVHEQDNLQIAFFFEESIGKNCFLYTHFI